MVFKAVKNEELIDAMGYINAEFYEKLLYYEKCFFMDYRSKHEEGYKDDNGFINVSLYSLAGFNNPLSDVEIGACLQFLRMIGFIEWGIEKELNNELGHYEYTIKYKFIATFAEQVNYLNDNFGTKLKSFDIERIAKGIKIMGHDEYSEGS